MTNNYRNSLERKSPETPETIEYRVANIENHYQAGCILGEAKNYATDPQAQHYIAVAASHEMNRYNQFRTTAGFFSNTRYKPDLIKALQALVSAGTISPETITPELSQTIALFKSRFGSEIIPAQLEPIFDAVPPLPLATLMLDRISSISAARR